MLKIYCYSNCGTCKKALKFLKENSIKYKEYPIRETPPTKLELKKMLKYQNGNIKKLFNTSSKDYRDGGYKETLPTLSDTQAIEILNQTGNLVKRPFVLGDNWGLVGFKLADWEETLKR